MPTLRQESEKIKTPRWISPKGRLVPMQTLEWHRCEVPAWLVARVHAYAMRFDWGKPMDPWEILRIIDGSEDWRNDWGTAILANGVEVFLSACGPHSADVVAKVLGVSRAMCSDGRAALGPSDRAWKESA